MFYNGNNDEGEFLRNIDFKLYLCTCVILIDVSKFK